MLYSCRYYLSTSFSLPRFFRCWCCIFFFLRSHLHSFCHHLRLPPRNTFEVVVVVFLFGNYTDCCFFYCLTSRLLFLWIPFHSFLLRSTRNSSWVRVCSLLFYFIFLFSVCICRLDLSLSWMITDTQLDVSFCSFLRHEKIVVIRDFILYSFFFTSQVMLILKIT